MWHERYSRFCHDHECAYPLPINEVIHDVRSHVRSIHIQVKKGMVVPHRHRALDAKGMSHGGIGFLSLS